MAGRTWAGDFSSLPILCHRRRCPVASSTRRSLTRGFEGVVAHLATKTDKTAITRGLGIDCGTVVRVGDRVVTVGQRLGRLVIPVGGGFHGVRQRNHHCYLTLVTEHSAGSIVRGVEGMDIRSPHDRLE